MNSMLTDVISSHPQPAKNINIVILYAQEDKSFWEELEPHLTISIRKYPNVKCWTSQEILPGREIAQEIRRKLHSADVAIFLLSVDFLKDERLDQETRLLLQAHTRRQNKNAYVLSLIVRDFYWEGIYPDPISLDKLEFFDELPEERSERDKIYTKISRALQSYLEEISRRPINFSIPTWIGYIGGIRYNRGFSSNRETSLFKKFQRPLQFKIEEDEETQIQSWCEGTSQLLPASLDQLPQLLHRLQDHEPRVIFQASWSDGADAILVRGDISSVEDLRGKRVLFPLQTPASSFLRHVLEEHQMNFDDLDCTVQKTLDLDKLSSRFLNDPSIDAVVIWSPYLEACMKEAPELRVLSDTSGYPDLIADVVIASRAYIDRNHEELTELFRGWLRETTLIRSNENGERQAAVETLTEAIVSPLPQIIPSKIKASLVDALNDFFSRSLSKIRLSILEDNLRFFGLQKHESSGKNRYAHFLRLQQLPASDAEVLQWEKVIDTSLLKAITS